MPPVPNYLLIDYNAVIRSTGLGNKCYIAVAQLPDRYAVTQCGGADTALVDRYIVSVAMLVAVSCILAAALGDPQGITNTFLLIIPTYTLNLSGSIVIA